MHYKNTLVNRNAKYVNNLLVRVANNAVRNSEHCYRYYYVNRASAPKVLSL